MHTKNASSKIKEDIRCAVENGSSNAFKKFSKNYQMYFLKRNQETVAKINFRKQRRPYMTRACFVEINSSL